MKATQMITRNQYDAAILAKEDADKIIRKFHIEKQEAFDVRLKSGVPFTDEELVYSSETLCPCGYGLAYPKDCGPFHYWDCSAILKDIADDKVQHTAKLPFIMYEVHAEGETIGSTRTTRGVFRPKPPTAP